MQPGRSERAGREALKSQQNKERSWVKPASLRLAYGADLPTLKAACHGRGTHEKTENEWYLRRNDKSPESCDETWVCFLHVEGGKRFRPQEKGEGILKNRGRN